MRVTESGPGGKGVLFVKVPRIGLSDSGGDSALRVGGVVFSDLGFGDDGDGSELGGFKGKSESGESTADDEKVGCLGSHVGAILSV